MISTSGCERLYFRLQKVLGHFGAQGNERCAYITCMCLLYSLRVRQRDHDCPACYGCFDISAGFGVFYVS